MAYKKTRRAVIRNKPQLDRMLAAKGAIKFYTNMPEELAHKINEALAASAKFPEFEHYHRELRPFVKIRVRADHVLVDKVEPLRIDKVVGESEEVLEEQAEVVVVPVISVSQDEIEEKVKAGVFSKAPPKIRLSEAVSLAEIILEATSEMSAENLVFERALLDKSEKRTLNAWCEVNSWNFIDQDEKGLTLTRRDVPDELKWRDEV